jgi:signal peptidase I
MEQPISAKQKPSSVKENIQSILFAILLALAFRAFCYEPFKIPSPSMKPILIEGDFIFTSKFKYGISGYTLLPFVPKLFSGRMLVTSPPNYGDIIVFKLPADPSIYYIKRLIGLPGDRVQMINGVLYINNQEAKQTYAGYFTDSDGKQISQFIETMPAGGPSYKILNEDQNGALDNTGIFEVPSKHYFFMGDNRDNSGDSRVLGGQVGYVPEDNIIGKAEFIFFSSEAPIWNIWKAITGLKLSRSFTPLAADK